MIDVEAPGVPVLIPASGIPSLGGLRCLVLGAGGFLGGALASALCERGAAVSGYGRPPHRSDLDGRVAWTTASLADTHALASALAGQEAVFHFVGSTIPETSNEDPAQALIDEVHGTIGLLDACVRSGVKKIVFASSGGTVYGVPALIPTPESAATDPISAYGIHKLAVEKYLALYRRLYGLDYLVLRLANPYGRGQSPFKKQGVIASMLHAALSGAPIEIWGTGEVVRDFVHIDDVVSALALGLAYDGPERIFNVGSGVGRSVNEILREVQIVLGASNLRVVRKPGRAADVPVSVLDTELIERELGWHATIDIRAGIRDTAAWMRAALAG